MPPSERSKKRKGNQGVTDNPHPGNNNGRRPNTRATTDSGTAPPAPPRLPPQKLSLKSLQQQLNDLQKITTRLADKLDADNVPHTSAVSTTVTTTVSSTGLLGVLPAGSPSVTSAANQGLLQQVTSTLTATTSSTIPIYSTNSVFGLQPPALLPTRTDGLGATLASSIMSTDRHVSTEVPSYESVSNAHSTISTAEQLNHDVNKLLFCSLAPATVTAYRLAWQHFRRFTLSVHGQLLVHLPIPEMLIGQFATFLHQEGFAPSSITSKLSAISFMHKLHNLPDPTSTFLIRKLVHSIQKHHVPDSRLPITPTILQKLSDIVPHIVNRDYDQCLFEAMFLFMYYSFARLGEVTITNTSQHTLNLDDITAVPDQSGATSYIKVQFKTYKHSKTSTPATLSMIAQPGCKYCPVSSLERFLLRRGGKSGCLFTSSNGSPVSSDHFTKVLKACVVQANLDPHKYTSHSFRIGAATQAAIQGVPDDTIQRLGRWSSDAFKKYIRI
ncbi:uncharacterized protein LOC118426678 isoform X2 [Branchiostoma floridae]|uniref:Uncharacterized protein LOC118426678 isoform X2 n=1 Tax=Branchiostoma floridae TaxID=7739 RepID=A0A9J7M175_BRAFL|nr:uncharacterized protein LOC118426678 isoform X2 [Branchiostoma floridae]